MLPLLSALLVAGLALGAPAGSTVPAPAGVGPATEWLLPVGSATQVARPFEAPATPYSAGHRGVDLRTEPGAPVRAAAAGVVTYVGMLAGRGVVTVTHGNLRSTYEPVDATVRLGQRVAAGDVIGQVAAGPGHCGLRTCLHWGLLRGTDYLDPLALLLRPGRVRLLPVWGVPVASQLDSVLAAVTDAVISTGFPDGVPKRRAPGRSQPAPRAEPTAWRSGTVSTAAGALGLTGAAAGAFALRRRT